RGRTVGLLTRVFVPSLLQCCHVFFFQAEDGIRDWSVTGVQTCALPISTTAAARLRTAAVVGGQSLQKQTRALRSGVDILVATPRSEERRVGKECRSRWAADQ